MKPEIIYIIFIFFVFGCFEFVRNGFWNKDGERKRDARIEVITGVVLLAVTQPLVLFLSYQLASSIAPNAKNAWVTLAIPLQVLAFLIFDDMTQYWWHRLAHRVPTLYRLHRVHHDVNYLSIRVVYRNNFWYYLFMPGLWFTGVLLYLGMAEVYAYYIAVKLTVITAAHSDVHWDEKLYKIKALQPLMWIWSVRFRHHQPTPPIMAATQPTPAPTIKATTVTCCSFGTFYSAPQKSPDATQKPTV